MNIIIQFMAALVILGVSMILILRKARQRLEKKQKEIEEKARLCIRKDPDPGQAG